jgi:hypothetical protein
MLQTSKKKAIFLTSDLWSLETQPEVGCERKGNEIEKVP